MTDENNLASFCEGGTGLGKELDISKVTEQVLEEKEIAEERAEYDAKVREEAQRIYTSGTVHDYILASCEKQHVCTSDEERHVLEVLICSCASMLILNCCGINPSIMGEAGIGKSDSATTVADHYPPENLLDGYLSKTALQHMTDLKPMTIVLRDDQAITGEASDIFNASLSKWDEDYVMHITNPKTHIVETFTIPRRCSRWTIYAHGTGNDQNHDRQIFLHPDASKTQRLRIHEKMEHDVEDPFDTLDTFTVDVSREIWRLLMKGAPYIVQIPFADEIISDDGEGNRTFKMMLCMTMCFSVMAKEKRERIRSPDKKQEAIVATRDDFKNAAKIMNALILGKGGSQKHKLTPTGEKILHFLMYPTDEWKNAYSIPFRMVRTELGISAVSLTRSLDELLEIVGIGIDTDGTLGSPNTKSFIIDRDAFYKWEGLQQPYVLREDAIYSDKFHSIDENLAKFS